MAIMSHPPHRTISSQETQPKIVQTFGVEGQHRRWWIFFVVQKAIADEFPREVLETNSDEMNDSNTSNTEGGDDDGSSDDSQDDAPDPMQNREELMKTQLIKRSMSILRCDDGSRQKTLGELSQTTVSITQLVPKARMTCYTNSD